MDIELDSRPYWPLATVTGTLGFLVSNCSSVLSINPRAMTFLNTKRPSRSNGLHPNSKGPRGPYRSGHYDSCKSSRAGAKPSEKRTIDGASCHAGRRTPTLQPLRPSAPRVSRPAFVGGKPRAQGAARAGGHIRTEDGRVPRHIWARGAGGARRAGLYRGCVAGSPLVSEICRGLTLGSPG